MQKTQVCTIFLHVFKGTSFISFVLYSISAHLAVFLYMFVCSYRYKVIVYSTVANRNGSKLWTTIVSLVAIWGISILLSFPLLLGRELKVINLNETMGPTVSDFIFAHTGKLTKVICLTRIIW